MHRIALLSLLGAGLTAAACRDAPKAGPDAASSEPSAAAPEPAPPATQGAGVGAGAASGGRGTVPVEITAVVGGKRYQAAGPGECQHTTEASIYNVPAALWRASFTAPDKRDLQSLNLTVWQPKAGGANQVTLAVQVGASTHQIATVRGGQMAGRGTAQVPSTGSAGSGGTLTVDGEDAGGAPLRVTVQCPRFTVPIAEGG